MKKQLKQIYVHLKPAMYSRFEKLAFSNGLRPSELVRFMIYQRLNQVDNKIK